MALALPISSLSLSSFTVFLNTPSFFFLSFSISSMQCERNGLDIQKFSKIFSLLTLYWLTSEVHVDIGSRHSSKTFRLKYYQSFSDPFFLLLLRKSYPQKALALLADQNPIGILFGTDFLLTDTGGCGHDVINAHLSLCLGFIWYIIHLYLRRKALKGVLRKGLSLDVLLI